MPTSMRVIDPKYVKGGRKLKKTNIAPFHKTWREIKSEKSSKIRKISYLLCVGEERRKRHHCSKMPKKKKTRWEGWKLTIKRNQGCIKKVRV